MLNEIKGWAGMFERMQIHPEEAPHNGAKVHLLDFCCVLSILLRSSLEDELKNRLLWKEGKTPVVSFLPGVDTPGSTPPGEEPLEQGDDQEHVSRRSPNGAGGSGSTPNAGDDGRSSSSDRMVGVVDPRPSSEDGVAVNLALALSKAPVRRREEEEWLQNPSGLAYFEQNMKRFPELEENFERTLLKQVMMDGTTTSLE